MNAEVSRFQELATANNISVKLLDRHISQIPGLSKRCINGLSTNRLEQYGDIVALTEQQLCNTPNVGVKNGRTICNHFQSLGLWMEMDVSGTKPSYLQNPVGTAKTPNDGPDSIAAAFEPQLEKDRAMIQSLKEQLETLQTRVTANEGTMGDLKEKEKTILDGFAAAGVEVSAEMRRTVVATLLKQAPALKA
jgi:hypothetical protein